MTFRAIFEILPIVELPEYRGLSVKAKTATVEEDKVDQEIERCARTPRDSIRWRIGPSRTAISSPSTSPGSPSTAERADGTRTPSSRWAPRATTPTMNATLVGMSIGETRETVLAYAEDHPTPISPASHVRYTMTLKAVKQKVLPASTTSSPRTWANWESLDGLARDASRAHSRLRPSGGVDRETRTALVDVLVDRSAFEVPEVLVERHMSERTESAASRPRHAGHRSHQDRHRLEGLPREAARGGHASAKRADILLDEIAQREGIEATRR